MSEDAPRDIHAAVGHGRGLHAIMRSAIRGADGDLALVALRVDDERLIIQAGLGPLAEDMVGNLMLVRDSVAAPVLLAGQPMLVPDYPSRGAAAPEVRTQIGSVMVVPLATDFRVEGALAVGRLVGRPSFVQSEVEELVAFVQRHGAVGELEAARAERRTARLIEDRTRIRDDLHDHVIQELFAVGMALQAVARQIADPEHREQVLTQVDALDATAHRVRSLISDPPTGEVISSTLPLPKRLVAIVDNLTPALRCLPTVTFVGPVESTVQPDLAEDLEAVLREALSNVAKHAAASSVQIKVSIENDRLLLDVIDDGRGIDTPLRSSGLTNMRRRASRHNGVLHLSRPSDGGTHLSWNVEISSGAPRRR